MDHFLAVHDVSKDRDEAHFREALQRVADTSTHVGVRPLETIYSLEAGRAFTLFSADSEDDVRTAHEEAGVAVSEVLPVDRVFTELLHVPQRERWS